jgi:hypothetical protein
VIECFKVENGVHEVIEKRFHHGHCQSHHAVSLLVDDAPLVGFLTSKSMGGNARMKLYWQTTSLYIYASRLSNSKLSPGTLLCIDCSQHIVRVGT